MFGHGSQRETVVELRPGTSIEGYELEAQLGLGGFGEVWRARARDGHLVAVKFLTRPSPDALRRFDIELEALARMNHSGCVRPIHRGVAGGKPFIVTEYVEGEELSAWRRRAPDVAEIVAVIAQIADVLAAAHREGIVHRDLKPANVLIRAQPGPPTPAVLDFGIAKLVDELGASMTKTGEAIGTVGFMSPEQVRGQRDIGPPTDMYALGVLFFELLEGHPPFEGGSGLEVTAKHLNAPVPPLTRRVSDDVADMVERMLDKDPARRPTAMAVVRAFAADATVEAALQDPTVARPARPASARATTPRKAQKWPFAIGAAGLLGVLAAAVLMSASDPVIEPAPPPERKVLPAIVSANTPTEDVPVATADAGRADAGPTPSRFGAGCAGLRPLRAGVQPLGALADGPLVRIPEGYSPDRRYPLVILFHDGFEAREEAITNIDDDIPGVDDYVFIVPRGNEDAITGHWRGAAILDRAQLEAIDVAAQVCVEPDEVYVIAHGHGGRAADALSCRGEKYRAIASFGYRWSGPDIDCKVRQSVPTLAVFPTEDPVAPADGAPGCGGGKFEPIDRQVERMRRRHECRGDAAPRDEYCSENTCGTELVTCSIPGGRTWKSALSGVGQLAAKHHKCPIPPPTAYPFVARALAFFAKNRPTATDR